MGIRPLKTLQKLMPYRCDFDGCQYGLRTMDDSAWLRKPWRVQTNCLRLQEPLSRKCPGDHEHRVLPGQEAVRSGFYTDEMVDVIGRTLIPMVAPMDGPSTSSNVEPPPFDTTGTKPTTTNHEQDTTGTLPITTNHEQDTTGTTPTTTNYQPRSVLYSNNGYSHLVMTLLERQLLLPCRPKAHKCQRLAHLRWPERPRQDAFQTRQRKIIMR